MIITLRYPQLALLSLLLFTGCQGLDPAVRSPQLTRRVTNSSASPAQGSNQAKVKPANRQKPAPLAEDSTKISTGIFTLYVSNQSLIISPVDIRIFIDGRPVVNGNFDLRQQQNWQKFPLTLTTGNHELRVESDRGVATLVRTIALQEKQWGVINYWCRLEEGKPRSGLTFELRDEPFYFDRND